MNANTDQPTPREEKIPCKHYWDMNHGGRVFCIHCDLTVNKMPASQPEPAKDEWRVLRTYLTDEGWCSELATPTGFHQIYGGTEEEAEANAKRIVEDHELVRSEKFWLNVLNKTRAELEQARASFQAEAEAFRNYRKAKEKELEQARALYQDRCQAVAKLREELEQAHKQIIQWQNEGLITLIVGEKSKLQIELEQARARIDDLERELQSERDYQSKNS